MAAVLEAPQAVSIRVHGGTVVDEEDDRSVGRSYSDRGRELRYFSHFFVAFRAEGDTAELEITDWAEEKDPGGPAGQKPYVDFNQAKPLFMGADG